MNFQIFEKIQDYVREINPNEAPQMPVPEGKSKNEIKARVRELGAQNRWKDSRINEECAKELANRHDGWPQKLRDQMIEAHVQEYNEWSSERSKFRSFQDRWLKYYMTFEHDGSKYAFIGDLYGNFNRNTTVSFNSFVVVQYDYKFPYLRSSPIRLLVSIAS